MAGSDQQRESDEFDAGASARREHQRRKQARERRMHEHHPRIARLRLAVEGEPQHEAAWRIGAEGEALVADVLMQRCGDQIELLHDRRLPGRRTNVDHIAVAASGVYVIDTKRYRGKIQVTRPWRGQPKLLIAGHDRTKLVAALSSQVESINTCLATVAPDVDVHGVLCFVAPPGRLSEGGLPVLRTLRIGDFALLRPRALAKRLQAGGPLDRVRAQRIAEELARRFPSA